MLGLAFYSVVAAGMGCLLPVFFRSGMSMIGIRFSLGYAAMVIFVYVAHVLLRVDLEVTVSGLAMFSLVGFITLIRRQKNWLEWQKVLVHPAFLLVVFGAAAIILNGGIGYLPYLNDEFSHWLATPRLIHLSRSWADVVGSINHSFYTPGWQLTLLLPWQVLGKEDFGLSAAAPFVLHVTVVALIFDIVVFQLQSRIVMAKSTANLAAWGVVLLFLAAEGMGRLWTHTLLIEQPQIYSYVTILLLIFSAETTGQDRKLLYGIAGIVLASAYLFKVAALIFIPAIIGLSCVFLIDRIKITPDRIKDNLLTTILLAGPILVATISWSMAINDRRCSPFSLSADQMAHVVTLDWKGLAVRFFGEVGTYVSGYKVVLTFAACLGVIGAFTAGKYRATLILVLLSLFYFALLYLFHLTCFGPYYFEHLNSIARFTRIPIQMFHALGLVMLFDAVLFFTARSKWAVHGGLSRFARRSWVVGSLIIVGVVLAGWQGRQLHDSVLDTTTRAYQKLDPRIEEMRTAAKRIRGLSGSALPRKPKLVILSQGQDGAVVSYAQFFAIGYRDGKRDPHFTVSGAASWSPKPSNVWQRNASDDEVAQQLSKVDIIWPTHLDPWLLKILGRLVSDTSCLKALPNKALIRDTTDRNFVRFKCIEKQVSVTD